MGVIVPVVVGVAIFIVVVGCAVAAKDVKSLVHGRLVMRLKYEK